MRKIFNFLGLCFSILIFSACASNSFTTFYQPISSAENQVSENISTCIEPKIAKIPKDHTFENVLWNMFEQGFEIMGTSEWDGYEHEGDEDAFEQGQKIGACAVLWRANYLGTEEGTLVIPAHIQSRASRIILADAYYRTASTYALRTIPSDYIAYGANKYNYTGIFFAKLINKPHKLMIIVSPPPNSYMKRNDSRAGCLVSAVMEKGNAYNANIFPGDIIASVNGKTCYPDKEISLNLGMKNEIIIFRDDKTLTKTINLPSL